MAELIPQGLLQVNQAKAFVNTEYGVVCLLLDNVYGYRVMVKLCLTLCALLLICTTHIM